MDRCLDALYIFVPLFHIPLCCSNESNSFSRVSLGEKTFGKKGAHFVLYALERAVDSRHLPSSLLPSTSLLFQNVHRIASEFAMPLCPPPPADDKIMPPQPDSKEKHNSPESEKTPHCIQKRAFCCREMANKNGDSCHARHSNL